jgi:hypothetical protein
LADQQLLTWSLEFPSQNAAVQVIARAVIGGIASVVGGGKCANGAVTAAFAYVARLYVDDGADNATPDRSGASVDRAGDEMEGLALPVWRSGVTRRVTPEHF